LSVKNNILHRKWYGPSGHEWLQIFAPRSLRPAIILAAHCPMPNANFKRNKMMAHIRTRYYWLEYLHDINIHLAICRHYLRRVNPCRRRAPIQTYNVGAVFQRVAVDILGTFRESGDGNRYLVTCYDQFTRWPEAVAVKDTKLETIAGAILYNVFSSFGIPHEIHSDRQSSFVSALFENVMKLLGIRHTKTTCLFRLRMSKTDRYNRKTGLLSSVNRYKPVLFPPRF